MDVPNTEKQKNLTQQVKVVHLSSLPKDKDFLLNQVMLQIAKVHYEEGNEIMNAKIDPDDTIHNGVSI